MACDTTCEDPCSCLFPSNSDCLTYKGSTLTCLDIAQGDLLTEILEKIDTAICDGIEPSGVIIYDVVGVSGEIVVTDSTIGDTTTFTVGIAPAFRQRMSNAEANIASLDACLDTAITELTSSTLTVSNNGNNGSCGKTWSIEYNPSGLTTYDGIIYNDNDKSGTDGTGGTQILKSFNYDYSNSSLNTRDEIRFVIAGQIDPSATDADTIIIELFNAATTSVVDSVTFSSFTNGNNLYQSFLFEGEIAVATATSGRYSCKLYTNVATNSTFSNGNVYFKGYDVNALDFSNLTIRIKFVNDSLHTSGNNYVHKLLVEVRKAL